MAITVESTPPPAPWWQALALRIIGDVVADYSSSSPRRRAEATTWLRSPDGAFWAEVAGLQLEALRDALRRREDSTA